MNTGVEEIGRTMEDLREIGKVWGILSLNRFNDKADLIRTIQLAEGRDDCFGRGAGCTDTSCGWRDDCLGRTGS